MKTLLTLGKLSQWEINQVWGKSQNLDTLLKAWYQVLEGFCIPESEYRYYSETENLSQELLGDLKQLSDIYWDSPLVLRSSASIEDWRTCSYAGQFESYLDIQVHDLGRYIVESYQNFKQTIISKNQEYNTLWDIYLWLLIQRRLDSKISWVAFSIHPLSWKAEIYIEAVSWYGENLVSGYMTPESYESDKEKNIWNTLLTDTQHKEIVEITKKIAKKLNYPVDIEWSYEDDTLYILQARPITTWVKQETHAPQEIFTHHISLTEWLEKIWHKATEKLREEDNLKRKRMGQLAEYIDFPYDAATSFDAQEIISWSFSDGFSQFFQKNKQKPCALRLIPKEKDFAKLRMRGLTIEEVTLTWFPKQDILPEKYIADFVPHPETIYWSSIFTVSQVWIQWECIAWWHHLLTQWLDISDTKRVYFYSDFTTLTLSEENAGLRKHLEKIFNYIRISSEKQWVIQKIFSISCINGYLPGYFETVLSKEFGLNFIDWNRNLWSQELITHNHLWVHDDTQFWGKVASGWEKLYYTGTLRDIREDISFTKNDILFCQILSPKYIPLLPDVWAIISEEWGILSHAAIVCRELKIPYIVGISRDSLIEYFWKQVTLDVQKGEIYHY